MEVRSGVPSQKLESQPFIMSRKPRPPVSTPSRPQAPARDRKAGPRPDSAEQRPRTKRPAAPAAPVARAKTAPAAKATPASAAPRFEAHEPQRIAKLLARAGVGSRRDVERMIAEGRVALNGAVLTTPATILTSLAGVTVDGNPVGEVDPTRLWRFFKPAGCLTTVRDPEGRPTIFDLLPEGLPRVVTIGRLDFNTEGLLLLTNNGELKRWLELPANSVERIYRARVRGRINYTALADLIEGITIDGVRYGSINAEVESSHGLTHWIAVKIREGKNREVRNVLGHLGLQVSRLIRTDYGPFTLDGLREGEVQEISAAAIPGVPRELLPPRDFEIEDITPRRREELFAPVHRRREAAAQAEGAPAPAAPSKGRDTRGEPRRRAARAARPEGEAAAPAAEPVRALRRQTRTAEARQAQRRNGQPVSEARGERPDAEAGTSGRRKLERKAGWAKPKVAARPKPRSASKPRGGAKPRGRKP